MIIFAGILILLIIKIVIKMRTKQLYEKNTERMKEVRKIVDIENI